MTEDEYLWDDERDFFAQQKADEEERQLRIIDILRAAYLADRLTKREVESLCAGCGIDRRFVLW